MVFSLVLLAASPVLLFLVKKPVGMVRNIFSVFFGIASWVGYFQSAGGHHPDLPRIRPGILTPFDFHVRTDQNIASDDQANLLYAKDYRIMHDLKIILNGFSQIGRRLAEATDSDSSIDK